MDSEAAANTGGRKRHTSDEVRGQRGGDSTQSQREVQRREGRYIYRCSSCPRNLSTGSHRTQGGAGGEHRLKEEHRADTERSRHKQFSRRQQAERGGDTAQRRDGHSAEQAETQETRPTSQTPRDHRHSLRNKQARTAYNYRCSLQNKQSLENMTYCHRLRNSKQARTSYTVAVCGTSNHGRT